MGYSTAWRSQWRILKQHICIWQFFCILLCSTGYTICSPWVLSCLWAILTDRYTGAALDGYLWKSNATGMNHLLLHSHILDFHTISAFYWSQERPVHPFVLGEQSVYRYSPHQHVHTHIHLISLFLQQIWEVYTGMKNVDACFCLALFHLPAAWHRQGHELGINPLAPLWVPYGLFHYRLWFCLPIICLPRQQIESGLSCPGIFWQLILFALPKA